MPTTAKRILESGGSGMSCFPERRVPNLAGRTTQFRMTDLASVVPASDEAASGLRDRQSSRRRHSHVRGRTERRWARCTQPDLERAILLMAGRAPLQYADKATNLLGALYASEFR